MEPNIPVYGGSMYGDNTAVTHSQPDDNLVVYCTLKKQQLYKPALSPALNAKQVCSACCHSHSLLYLIYSCFFVAYLVCIFCFTQFFVVICISAVTHIFRCFVQAVSYFLVLVYLA